MMNTLKCPRCGKDMVYDEQLGFWRCPSCGGEWWEDADKLALVQEKQQAVFYEAELRQRTLWGISKPGAAVLPPVPVVAGRKSTKKAGRKYGSSRRQYKLWTQRYMLV